MKESQEVTELVNFPQEFVDRLQKVYDAAKANPRPRKPSLPIVSGGCSANDHRTHADALEVWEAKDRDYKAERETRRTREYTVIGEFKEAAIKEAGIEGHPKADKAYSMAWERGHSYGLNEVWHNLEELADLLIG